MTVRVSVYAAVLLAAFVYGPRVSIAAPSASMLANTCAGCHGTDGVSSGPATPTIAGMSTEYFIDMMEAYKSDEYPSTVMGLIAKGYSEDEIETLAKYFAELPFVTQEQSVDAAKSEKQKNTDHELRSFLSFKIFSASVSERM